MKNLNEPHRRPDDVNENLKKDEFDEFKDRPRRPEGEVISLQEHRSDKAAIESSLVSKRQIEGLRSRWMTVQAAFVDEPRKAVQDADELVSSAIKEIEEGFRSQREQLEKQWTTGTDVSTEDLRKSLQHYRTFFNRLLSL